MSLRKVCPQCGAIYGAESRFCSVDGATLVFEGPADNLVGTIVADRYHILERIGVGGMGEVFLAEHVRMKRKSALKIMREALTSDPIAVSRFHREAENASQISHPNVAAVYDFGETSSGLVYIAMEYIPGEPLSDVLAEEGAINPARVADIIAQASDALSAAHGLGILHRDLKPDNIMLGSTRWGTDLVKLVDFGISRAMASATQQFTSTGIIVGTPDYMSPEQLTGDTLDSRSDQYALGLIAFYSLTGSFPFPTGASKEALLSRLTHPPRKLAEVNPDIAWPTSLQFTLDRALAQDVAERYAEVHEFGREFEAAISEMPSTETMERYREALRQRFITPTRAPSVTPSRPMPSVETTPIALMPSVEREVAVPLAATAAESSPPMPAATPPVEEVRTRRPSAMARLTAVGAAVALVGVVVWQIAAAREDGGAPASPVAAAESSTVPATPPTQSAAAGSVAPTITLDSAVATARSGIFTVYGAGQQGSAFLVDSAAGIVLTSAEFTRGGSEPQIQLDPDTRAVARVMHTDAARGVAALRIPMRHCRRCTALSLAVDSASRLALGDSLVVPTPGARSAAGDARGAVTSDTGRTAQTSLRLSERGSGGPVLSRHRGVVAMALRRARGQTSLVNADALSALVASARRRRSEVLPNDTLVATWPSAPMARSVLAAALTRTDDQLAPYRVVKDGLAVLAMTPQVMAWRNDRARQQISGAQVMSLNDSAQIRFVDPVQLWRYWDAYVSDRRAVVVLHVTPELASYPLPNRRLVQDLKRGDVEDLRLYRDGVLVAPIESARIPAVVNDAAYRAQRQYVYTGAIGVYNPREFARKADGKFPEMRVEVSDARPRRTVALLLPEAALSAIERDLGSYQR